MDAIIFRMKSQDNGEKFSSPELRGFTRPYENNNLHIGKDNCRVKHYMKHMNIRATTNSHFFSHNMCMEHRKKKENQIQRKYTNKDAETLITVRNEKERLLERTLSEYSNDAYLFQKTQDKPEPLINNKKKNPCNNSLNSGDK